MVWLGLRNFFFFRLFFSFFPLPYDTEQSLPVVPHILWADLSLQGWRLETMQEAPLPSGG